MPNPMQANQALAGLVNHLSTAIVLVNSRLQIVALNLAAENLFRVSQHQMQLEPLTALLNLDPHLAQQLQQSCAQQKSFTIRDTLIQQTNGRQLWIDLTVTSVDEPGSLALEIQPLERMKRLTQEARMATQQHASSNLVRNLAHEIKNPLASLRSAVGTMRVAKREDQREKLLLIIEHDVKRLDRLVSDISNASRLDSELVKEEEETFDLVQMLRNIADFLGKDARLRGVDFVADLPADPIMVQGLEGRMAQVFVNLISNAISFCEKGDAIRIWARTRKNRVLVVVEDTGPGIPDGSLTKIFQRFYSERPVGDFGNNSGLGLAISKQIVTAHAGVIWAENIRPTDADPTSEPLGARFVVGLPL